MIGRLTGSVRQSDLFTQQNNKHISLDPSTLIRELRVMREDGSAGNGDGGDDNDDAGTDIEDRITEAILGDSVYERLRAERTGVSSRPIPQKLTAQSGLLVALALVFPISVAFPAPVKASFPAGDPLLASPGIVLLGALALALVVFTGTSLAAIEYCRLRFESRLTHAQAEALLNGEDLATLFGIGTAGSAVLATDGLALLGLGGLDLIRVYTKNAFAASGTGISVAALATASLCGAVVLYAVSQSLPLVGDRLE